VPTEAWLSAPNAALSEKQVRHAVKAIPYM